MAETSTHIGIAEVAIRTGLSAHTLRYYERDGLMPGAVGRGPTGRRAYTPDDVRWIEMLTRLRSTGMPIREVREYAALVRLGPGNEGSRLALLQRHRERVRGQLSETTEHLRAIETKINLYADTLGSADRLDLERTPRACLES